jgi:TonB-linked SusC/RagA family outer membrane protein
MKKNRMNDEVKEIPHLIKLLRVMKITCLLLMVFLVQVSASTYSQSAKLTLNLKNTTLSELFNEIEKVSEFCFLYDDSALDLSRKVTLSSENSNIEAILDDLFKGLDISYEIFDRYVILKRSGTGLQKSFIQQQKKTITGKVTDENNQPISGVTVVIKGTIQGTVTNIEGNYSLANIPNDATLVFSFVGMQSKEINIDNQNVIDVVLTEKAIGVEEIVVVGYGTQKKINLTGSVDAVSGEKLQNRSATKLADLIQGTSPNLNITMNFRGGEPGAESSWNIRGTGTIQGNDAPLVLVDGVEMNLNNVDPESIESVSVLKDASSSAIYGSRAPFGVVLITTKKGKQGEKVQIQYSNNLSLASPIKVPSFVDALTWATAYNQANANAGLNPVYADEQVERIKGYMDGTFPYEYDPDNPINNIWAGRRNGNANNNWPQIMIKDFSFSQKHNINVSGGNEKTQYYVAGGLVDQGGMYTYGYDSYKRYNFLTNFTSQITNWLSFNSSIKYAKSKTDYPLGETTVGREHFFREIIMFAPMMPMYNINGTIQCPLIRLMQDSGRDKGENNDFFVTLGTELEPIKGWKSSVSFNHNVLTGKREVNPRPVMVELGDGSFGNIGKPTSGYQSTFSQSNYTLYNVLTSYEKTFGGHYLKALIGYEQEETVYSDLYATAENLITDEVPSISTALGATTVDDTKYHWATQGVFGRFNYNFQEKYLLEFSARYNGSSRFAKGSRWGFFPSASAGYNISKENFWSAIKPFVNTFKLRGSYGALGNQNVSNYLYLSTIPVTNELKWILDGERPPYAVAPALVSDDLTWETITTLNLGFDAEFLNNRLGLVFDWFDRKTTDMIGPSETLPYTLGTSTPTRNNAELSTKGFEIILKWKDRISDDFSYDVQISIGDSRSTILKYKNDKGLISTWYDGKEVGEIWGYVTDGLIQEEGEDMPDQSYFYASWRPGDMKYKELSNDGKIDPGSSTLNDHGDLTVIGNTTPRYNIGIIAGCNWKGFDFRMLWQGIGKRDYYPHINSTIFYGMTSGWASSGIYEDSPALDYWRPVDETNLLGPNTDAYFAKPYFTTQTNKNRQTQSRYVLNAAYLRLKNLQVGYTIPQRISKKIFLEKARIYLSGENLITFSGLPKNHDPETIFASDPSYGGYLTSGVIYPISSTLSIGLNLTF